MFRGGAWHLDLNGDGRFSDHDLTVQFGQPGDRPIVGDWNGDGVDELAVYRAGQWILDTNGNREIDAIDQVFEMGGPDDTPISGDFNGDGTDDPAIYSPGHSPQVANAG